MMLTKQGVTHLTSMQRRRQLLIGASSLIALTLPNLAVAQSAGTPTQSSDAQNSQTNQPGPVQPAVPATANSLSASQAGTPQDAVTSPGASTSNTVADPSADIVVTGLRGSLQRNLDIKRTATGVVDAISAEDIGKFPDSNVAASLQRLPGVSIQRSGNRGEATGITVRGFGGDFNTTLFDGRRVSSPAAAPAGGGSASRQIDFSTVGSDFIGQLSVLKTPDVTLTSSSIGATVNIEFPKPFDHPGFRLAASGSGSIQDRSGKVVPTAGLLLSNTFADETIGVLADVIYTRRDTVSNRVSVSGWAGGNYAPCQLAGSTSATCAPTSDMTSAGYANTANRQNVVGWFPQQYVIDQEKTKDERIDGRIALQWHPSDDLMVTVDDNFSRQKIVTDVPALGVWFNQGALRNVTLDKNGTAVNFSQPGGSPTDFTAAINTQVIQTNQLGGNVKWDVSSNFTVDADVAYAKSWLNPDDDTIGSQNGDIGYGGALANNAGVAITGSSSDSFPSLTSYGPGGNMANFQSPGLIGSHVVVNQTQNNTDELKQARLTGTWKQDDLTIRFGGQYYEDKFNLSNKSTFTNNFWQAYAGYGGPSGQGSGISPLPANLYQGTVNLGKNFIPGFTGTLPPSLIVFNPIQYQSYLTSLGNPQAQNVPGFNYGNVNGFTGTFDQAVDPNSLQQIKEKTWSLYMNVAYQTEIASMPFHFSAGLRNENTHLSSSGQGRLPTSITTSSADPTLLSVSFGAVSPITSHSNYSYLLPSVDLRLEVTDNLQVRFDASRTLTRPGLGNLNPVLAVGVGQRVGALTGSGGNPNLKPYLADNFDVAGEWYYKRNSYISVDLFLKNVSNFIVGGVTRQSINGVVDPTTGQLANFAVSQQVNGPDATVRGVEIAWQHVFGDTGFGFNANATFVGTNKPYNAQDISQTGFAVTGLANSANFVGFYDKNGFQFRAAVNWRDKYLLQFGQNQNTSNFGAEPTFVNSSLQLDLSTSYDINEHFSVFGEVQNVNNNQQSTHGRFDNQLLDVYDYGRRFQFGARFRL